jgi:hypothetical protein
MVAVATLLSVPAADAHAKRRAQKLVSVAPVSTTFKDAVIERAPRAHASGAGITVSDGYENGAAVKQSYADFLELLPHGAELDDLSVLIAPPAEVVRQCGGADGLTACYVTREQLMIVPGEPPPDAPGVSVSYLMAHEYGHHLSAYRDNSPFRALETGPKYWSSFERVCARVREGKLAPGNERDRYRSNPAEAWAEVYARLTYPDMAWRMTPLLKPTEETYAAAILDVAAPWTAPKELVLTGRFGEFGKDYRDFTLPTTLDGTVELKVEAERAMLVGVALRTSLTKRTTRARGLSATVCRRGPGERVTVRVRRRAGNGPFTLRATYPG